MACAASTEAGTHHGPTQLDIRRRYRLDPQVALRPEPFGALAYHYGNRRLVFLRSPELVGLVRSLDAHSSVQDALAASGISEDRWPAMTRALASLERSELIRAQ